MRRFQINILVISVFCILFQINTIAQTRHSCSTFLLRTSDSLVIGHNLDDYIDVSGLVVVNKKGVEKENLTWKDFRKGIRKDIQRIKWVSKYGSITYNTIGKDLIDGGMNETGLYIGEMTLFGTKYPSDANTPSIYHHFWMQYILDTYCSVAEVLENISKLNIDGTCTWHFFIADIDGNSATIEFLDGKAVIHTGNNMPYTILCNSTYSSDLDSIALYQGYGGSREIDIIDKVNTKRTVRGTELIRRYQQNQSKPIIDYSFDFLSSLDLGNNKWQIVYDLRNLKMFFRSYKSSKIKYVNFSSFDFSKNSSSKFIDIHTDFKGDVSSRFTDLTFSVNERYCRQFWENIDFGFFGNIFIKPIAIWKFGGRMNGYLMDFS